jgi:hypothetical protein
MSDEEKKDKFPIKEEASELFSQYWNYAISLKQWYIGFGIGLFLLLVSHPEVFGKITDLDKKTIFALFSLAIFFQILIAFFNKISQYYLYLGKMEYILVTKIRFKLAYKYSSWFFIECIFDIITGLLYIIGVIILLR